MVREHARERDLVEYSVPRRFGMETQGRYLEHDATSSRNRCVEQAVMVLLKAGEADLAS